MSSLTGLTKRQVQVLWAVDQLNREQRLAATGSTLLGEFQKSALETSSGRSTQGLHQTAASLVRRGALYSGHTGTHTVAYSISAHGKALLDREVEVHGRPL